MITKVILKNFHKHQFLEVNFKDGLNVITGETDSGKSAILRAIYWVIQNKPRGTDYIRDDEKAAEVTIHFSDGNVVTRKRTPSLNCYILNGETMKMDASGNSPPEPVAKIMNLSDINYQDQWDLPFMLSMSPPEVARFLNSVSGLSMIDDTMARISSKARKTKTDLNSTKGRVEERKQDLKQFDYLESMEAGVIKLEELHKTKANSLVLKDKLVLCLDTYKEKQRQIDGLSWIESAKKTVLELEKIGKKADSLESRRLEIGDLKSRYDLILKKIKICTSLITAKPKIDKLVLINKKIISQRNKKETIERLVSSYITITQKMTREESQIQEWSEKVKELMPDECPLCGQEIKCW